MQFKQLFLLTIGLSFLHESGAEPVGYWSMDDGTVGAAASTLASSINTDLLTATAGGNGTGMAPVYVDDVPGQFIYASNGGALLNADNTSALSFSASTAANGGYVSIQDDVTADSLLEPSSFTIEAFVKSDGTQDFSSIISKSLSGSALLWNVGTYWRPSAISLRVDSLNPSFAQHNLNINNTLVDSGWHHIALTYNSSTTTFSLYQDYELVGSLVQVISSADDAPIVLGNFFAGNAFTGLIDEFRLSDSVLEPSDFMVAVTPRYTKHYLGESGLEPVTTQSLAGPHQMNADFFGNSIQIAGVPYEQGVGVYAEHELTLTLDGAYAFFVTDVGLDDMASETGSVQLKVYGDDSLLYTSAILTPGERESVNVVVSGVTTLRLVVEGGADGTTGDVANLGAAHLLKSYEANLEPTWRAVEINTEGNEYNGYWEFLPTEHLLNPDEKRPVVIFFHGLGEGGDGLLAAEGEDTNNTLNDVLHTAIPAFLKDELHFLREYLDNKNVILLAPQTTANTWWGNTSVDRFVEYAKSRYPVDSHRIYLTGLSSGSNGIASYINYRSNSEDIAAILLAAVRGRISQVDGINRARYIPCWALTAIGDSSNAPRDSVNAISGALLGTDPTDVFAEYPGSDVTRTASFDVNLGWVWEDGVVGLEAGNHPKFTLYPGSSHYTWNQTYLNLETWDWLLSQVKPRIHIVGAEYPVVINVGSALELSVDAYDVDGVTINSATYTWTSDRDGVIGSQKDLSNTSLSVGEHEITCQVVDEGLRRSIETVTVEVLAAGQPTSLYEAWSQTQGLVGSDASPTTDGEGDGFVNLLEYALDLDTSTADAPSTQWFHYQEVDGQSYLSLEFDRPQSANDLIYTVEVSDDLSDWTTVGISHSDDAHTGSAFVSETDVGGRSRLLYRDDQPVSNYSKRFMRLRVNEQ